MESLKEFERDIKAQSKRQGRVVAHHHDDDKAFRGVVEAYAREQGWKDTHTGGHKPSSNAVCERRIGTDMTLQQLLKAQRMPIGCLRKMLQTRAVAASDIASSKSELANEVLKLCGYDVLPDAKPPRAAHMSGVCW